MDNNNSAITRDVDGSIWRSINSIFSESHIVSYCEICGKSTYESLKYHVICLYKKVIVSIGAIEQRSMYSYRFFHESYDTLLLIFNILEKNIVINDDTKCNVSKYEFID